MHVRGELRLRLSFGISCRTPQNTIQPFETLLSFYLHLDTVQCVSEGKRRGCATENKHWTRSHFILGREDNDGNQICAENGPRTFLAEILRRLPALAATICNDNENIRLMRHIVLFFFLLKRSEHETV